MQCGIVYCQAAALEWVDGAATKSSALEFARVIDSAPLQYEIGADSFVYMAEVLHECMRLEPRLHLPELPILHRRGPGVQANRASEILAASVPGIFSGVDAQPAKEEPNGDFTRMPFASVAFDVERAMEFREKRRDAYEERVAGESACRLPDDGSGNR